MPQGESVNPAQFCSPTSPGFPHWGVYLPHSYDVFLRILALKVCALYRHSSHLPRETWIVKQKQERRPNPWVPLSTRSLHIHTKAHSKGEQPYKWKQSSFSKTESSLIWFKIDFLKECSLESLCWFVYQTEKQHIPLPSLQGTDQGKQHLQKPCHVLRRSQGSRAAHTISEQHSGLFLLTVIAFNSTRGRKGN